MKRQSTISFAITALLTIISTSYSSIGESLNYTCSIISKLSSSKTSLEAEKRCSFDISLVEKIESRAIPLAVIFKGANLPKNYTFLDVVTKIDEDKDIRNGVTITAKGLDEFIKRESIKEEDTKESFSSIDEKPSILLSEINKIFYSEIDGELYKIYFASSLESLALERLSMTRAGIKESGELYFFGISYAKGDIITITGEEFRVSKTKETIKLISTKNSQIIKMSSSLIDAIKIYSKNRVEYKSTKVSFLEEARNKGTNIIELKSDIQTIVLNRTQEEKMIALKSSEYNSNQIREYQLALTLIEMDKEESFIGLKSWRTQREYSFLNISD